MKMNIIDTLNYS